MVMLSSAGIVPSSVVLNMLLFSGDSYRMNISRFPQMSADSGPLSNHQPGLLALGAAPTFTFNEGLRAVALKTQQTVVFGLNKELFWRYAVQRK